MVSYANRGGGKAAEQLQQVLQGIHMRTTESHLEIKLSEVNFSPSNSDASYPETLCHYENALISALNQLSRLHTSR